MHRPSCYCLLLCFFCIGHDDYISQVQFFSLLPISCVCLCVYKLCLLFPVNVEQLVWSSWKFHSVKRTYLEKRQVEVDTPSCIVTLSSRMRLSCSYHKITYLPNGVSCSTTALNCVMVTDDKQTNTVATSLYKGLWNYTYFLFKPMGWVNMFSLWYTVWNTRFINKCSD